MPSFSALGRRDLVKERRELLVGLDRGLVILEARQASVHLRDLLLQLAARLLVHRSSAPWPIPRQRSDRDAVLHLALCRRQLAQPSSRQLSGRVELLQRNEGGEGRRHQRAEGKGQRAKGKGQRRTGSEVGLAKRRTEVGRERRLMRSVQSSASTTPRPFRCPSVPLALRTCCLSLFSFPLPFALCPLPSNGGPPRIRTWDQPVMSRQLSPLS